MRITLKQVVNMDEVCGEAVLEFVRHTRVATFCHEDNLAKVKDLAKKHDFSQARMSKYLWLQVYIAELASTFDDLEPPESVAGPNHYDFRWSEFEAYYMARAEVLRYVPDDSFREPEPAPHQLGFWLDPWDDEDAITVDTQEDAELQGD